MPSPPNVELPSVDITWKKVRDLLTLSPPTPRPYISYVHTCAHCGTKFRWASKSKLFCPDCAKARERAHWVRTNRKRWAKKKPLPDDVPKGNVCARCGSPIPKRKRLCAGCRRVREMDGDAARKRLKSASSVPAFNADAVPAEQYAPSITKD